MFNPGQRVLAIPSNEEGRWSLATVLGRHPQGEYHEYSAVVFDENVGGHTCEPEFRGPYGHCWWVRHADIKELHEPDWYLENGEEDPCRPPSSLT